jgi:hypothetical protein
MNARLRPAHWAPRSSCLASARRCALAVTTLAALAAPADATEGPPNGKTADRAPEGWRGAVHSETALPSDRSPQHFALEVRFGPYTPRIDDETDTPVRERFFGDTRRYLVGLELDWQLWRAPYVGTLGLGAGWGYTSLSGPNQVPAGSVEPGDPPPNVSQKSTLHIMPLYAVGVLRVDALARNLSIPIVPYGKLGLAAALWWVNNGLGTASSDTGVKGRDTSIGTQAALGAMLLLDFIEPSVARTLDTETGVNNTYLFIEWSVSDFNGDQMNVGSSTWTTGLALEL